MKILKLINLLILSCASFLSLATTYEFTENNNIELLHNSKEAAEIKLELIRNAKHHIHIMSYFLDNSKFPLAVFNELKKAHKRGVEVRIIATFIPTLAKDLTLKTFDNLRVEDNGTTFGYLLLHPKDNLLLLNNLHEKIFLIDGQVGILGGRNLSDSSFKAKDLEAKISGGIVHNMQDHFLKMFNAIVKIEEKRKCKKQDIQCQNSYRKLSFNRDDSNYFPETIYHGATKGRLIAHNAVLKQIEKNMNHKERVEMEDDIMNIVTSTEFTKMRAYNYYILPTKKYNDFLIKNIEAHKEIKIITNSLKTSAIVSNLGYIYSLPIMSELVSKGVDIYQWQGPNDLDYLHEKVIIFDDAHILLGSHNFGIGSTAVSNEIMIEFFSEEIGKTLSNIFDEEIGSSEKTIKATNLGLAKETVDNLKMTNFLHKTSASIFIEESY